MKGEHLFVKSSFLVAKHKFFFFFSFLFFFWVICSSTDSYTVKMCPKEKMKTYSSAILMPCWTNHRIIYLVHILLHSLQYHRYKTKAANVPQKGDMASLEREKIAPLCFIKPKSWRKLHVSVCGRPWVGPTDESDVTFREVWWTCRRGSMWSGSSSAAKSAPHWLWHP